MYRPTQLLELGLGASTRAGTKARTGLALGLGLTVGLEIVSVLYQLIP